MNQIQGKGRAYVSPYPIVNHFNHCLRAVQTHEKTKHRKLAVHQRSSRFCSKNIENRRGTGGADEFVNVNQCNTRSCTESSRSTFNSAHESLYWVRPKLSFRLFKVFVVFFRSIWHCLMQRSSFSTELSAREQYSTDFRHEVTWPGKRTLLILIWHNFLTGRLYYSHVSTSLNASSLVFPRNIQTFCPKT